jgi:dipeptidyl aminopeptidase/acylaminoacyl peptidase
LRTAVGHSFLPAVLLAPVLLALAGQSQRPTLYEPAISPDGRTVAFVSGGDIWTVAGSGGEARLLVSHPANESRPLWSPDGRQIAFVSERTGNGDIYVLEVSAGVLTRLTYDDSNEQLDGWSAEGQWIYLNSASKDIAGMRDVYRVRSTGGTPMAVAADRYASEYWAAPSPDGRLAITARGVVSGQWWRNGHSHLDESEIWLVTPGDGRSAPEYRLAGDGGAARDAWPMWSADGSTLFYVSNRGGTENIWSRPANGGNARRISNFRDGRVLWPTISRDGSTIAFERDFGIWILDELLYRDCVRSRRDYMHRIADGRLGYVHIPDMSQVSLDGLYADLDTENYGRDGVVIDIRGNNGGFVNAYALDVFARRPYLTMTRRGSPPAPGRSQLGQRSLEKPTVLVINQHSLSDAEDFTEGYRALGLGRIVGEETAGWIIYTSNITLLDGTTTMRVPFMRVQGARGDDMEMHPRVPDVKVVRPVGESYSGRDSQLDAAVRELLATIR